MLWLALFCTLLVADNKLACTLQPHTIALCNHSTDSSICNVTQAGLASLSVLRLECYNNIPTNIQPTGRLDAISLLPLCQQLAARYLAANMP
jgi:hypothetical protein